MDLNSFPFFYTDSVHWIDPWNRKIDGIGPTTYNIDVKTRVFSISDHLLYKPILKKLELVIYVQADIWESQVNKSESKPLE